LPTWARAYAMTADIPRRAPTVRRTVRTVCFVTRCRVARCAALCVPAFRRPVPRVVLRCSRAAPRVAQVHSVRFAGPALRTSRGLACRRTAARYVGASRRERSSTTVTGSARVTSPEPRSVATAAGASGTAGTDAGVAVAADGSTASAAGVITARTATPARTRRVDERYSATSEVGPRHSRESLIDTTRSCGHISAVPRRGKRREPGQGLCSWTHANT
jgi:hypothetical protein